MLPNRKRVVPRMVWNAVGSSTHLLNEVVRGETMMRSLQTHHLRSRDGWVSGCLAADCSKPQSLVRRSLVGVSVSGELLLRRVAFAKRTEGSS
jgi:hypothetical protein